MKPLLTLLTLLLLAPQTALRATEPWWHEYTPVATVGLRAESLETIQPGAARGVGTLGWYGFWSAIPALPTTSPSAAGWRN